MNFRNTLRYFLLLGTAALMLCGCESDDAGARHPVGVFVDGPVAGLYYRCGSATTLSGVTTPTGAYSCPAGETVSFYVGSMLLGTIPTTQPVTTPLDLVGPGATIDNDVVNTVAGFLMAVSSTNPLTSNTITVLPAVHTRVEQIGMVDLDLLQSPTGNIAVYIVMGINQSRYSPEQIREHLAGNLNRLFAGNYAGESSGGANGDWQLTIGNDGTVLGNLQRGSATEALTGSMLPTLVSHGRYAFTGTVSGSTWNGFLDTGSGEFSGTWTGDGSQGTYTGARQ